VYVLSVIGFVNLAPVPSELKIATIILIPLLSVIFFYIFIAFRPDSEDDLDQVDEDQGQDEARPHIPPMPANPPSVAAKKPSISGELNNDSTAEQDHVEEPEILVDTYQHRLSLIPLLFRFFLATVVWLAFLYISIISNSSELWVAFVIATLALSSYCYYKALVWNGEDYIVNEKWVGMTATLPWPLPSKEPQILRTQINSIEIVETMLDKFFHTCQLKLKTEVSAKRFEHIRWLTHPDELRRALGKSTPRKNHFLFWLKRKN